MIFLFACLLGVKVLAVGVDQADTVELYQAVSDGNNNLLYTSYPAQLNTLQSNLADLLCGIARAQEVGRNQKKYFVYNLELELSLV